jgi:glycosyltransferase-like protein
MHLKIALFTYATKPRGSVIHTLELAAALQNLGHEVCVYALAKDGAGFDRPLTFAVKLVPTQPAPANIDALIQQRTQEFVDYLTRDHLDYQGNPQEKFPYDCYHAQDCISANALLLLKKSALIPKVMRIVRTVHHVEDYTSPYLRQCQDRSIREPALCLSVSQYWQEKLQQDYGIFAPRVINGVNTQLFSSQATKIDSELRTKWQLTGTPIYLTVGGIEPRKNSLSLLTAFAEVLTDFPQAQLVIVGGATLFDYQDYRQQFFALAQQLGIEIGKSLILPGVVTDAELVALYRLGKALVFPSVKEGWGLVVLEAIASGLPVITANQPPFTEFLDPTQALLIDPQHPKAIAQAMRLILDPPVAKSLIHNSRSIPAAYSWETSAKMHLTHYQQLLASQ